MNKRTGLGLSMIICVILSLVCWWIAFQAGNSLSALPEGSLLRWDNARLDYDRLESIQEGEARQLGEKYAFSAFSQLEEQSIIDKVTEKRADCNVILFFGNAGDIIPEASMNSSDKEGILLDKKTADSLWGKSDPVGETVLFGERELMVRGIINTSEKIALIPFTKEDTQSLSVIYLDTRLNNNPRQTAEDFYSRHGLGQPDAVTTGAWLKGTAKFFSLLPVLLIGLVFLVKLFHEIWQLRNKPVLCILWCIGTVTVLIIAILLSGIKLSVPQNLIPTRWSDFEFWGRLIETEKENLINSVIMPKLIPDKILMGETIPLIVCSITSSIFLFLSKTFYKKWNS